MPDETRRIVLDANILIRATLGRRVRHLLDIYEESVVFCTPDICVSDARRNFVPIAISRGADLDAGLRILDQILQLIEVVDLRLYEPYEAAAGRRMASRDSTDWPIAASALSLKCPIWTEDGDFFGCGIATWTTTTVELYFKGE